MKRNSDLRNTWSSCVMQMLKRQTRVKGAVFIHKDLFAKLFAYAVFLMLNFFFVFVLKETFARLLIGFYVKKTNHLR